MTTECEAALEEMRGSIERDLMAQMEEAVERGVVKALRQEFRAIGLYADTAEQQIERGKDFRYLNLWRLAVEKAAVIIGTAVLMLVTGGVVAAFWLGVKLHLLKQP